MIPLVLYVVLYVVNFIMIIPSILVASDYWEEGKEEGKDRRQVILIRYIQYVLGITLGIWILGQISSLCAWTGGATIALSFISTTLAIVVILLASIVYAWLLERGGKKVVQQG